MIDRQEIMAKGTNNAEGLKRLDTVLAVYGSNPAEWPQSERAGLEDMIGADPSAARLLDEAVALERVMAHAPPGKASEALKSRIVAAAVDDGGADARVIPISVARWRRGRGLARGRTTMWPAAALAASFAFGLYLGLSGLGVNTVDQALEFASLDVISQETDDLDLLPSGNGGDQDNLL